ncbi:MAG: TonB-dependent receptor, partial [Candidatus Neomarinimicrobiota bacterium]
PNAVKGWLKSRHEANSLRDDFEGSELFTAAYIMGDFNIGPRLSLIGGGRFEHFNMDYTANFVYCTHSVDGDANEKTRTIERNDDTFFPNAQIRYKFTEWGDIRAAYSKTISRPDYMAILPSVYYENGGGVAAGNSNLKPAVANNIDVYMSLYNNEIGLLTIGGFYKKIDDVFFRTEMYYPFLSHYGVSCPDSAGMVDAGLNIIPSQVPGQSTVTTTYVNNPNPAYIRGFELDWQTYFWYLPKPFNTLVLSANYTKSWSEMDYQQLEREDSSYSVVVNGRTKYYTKYKTVERVRNMRLLGQADDVVNIAIGVNHKGFAGRLSFRYTGEMLSSAGVRRNEIGIRPEDDLYTRPITRWDISITQKLPIKGLLIGFEGVNIFHSPEETYKIFRRAAGEPIIENLVTTRYIPRKFSLYLRYNFE